MLTILSTILGFVPFIIGTKEAFWYPLAIGTIGGLLMSLVGIYFFLPVFMGIGREHRTEHSRRQKTPFPPLAELVLQKNIDHFRKGAERGKNGGRNYGLMPQFLPRV